MGRWEKKDDQGAVPVEIKDAFNDLQNTLQAVRTKQDEVDAELKKRGSADVVATEHVKRIDKALDQTKADIDELFKKLSRPTFGVNSDPIVAAHEAKALVEIKQWLGEQDDVKAAKFRAEYKATFDRMVRKGRDVLTEQEFKTLAIGSAPDGGFWLEPARADYIVQRMRETSAMRAIASVTTISSNEFVYPVDRDDLDGGWVGEQSSRPATGTPKVGEGRIRVHEMYAMPKATQTMLDDVTFDLEGWLNSKLNDRFARYENTAFVSGNGTSRPRGFLTGTPVTTADASRAFGVLQYIATGASGAFATASATVSPADKLLDLIFAFNAGYRGSLRWTMNKTTLGAVRKFKDQQGNYVYDPRLNGNGVIDMVLNYPVTEFADMADYTTANSFAIALGDFRRGYQIIDRQGIRQTRDPFTARPFVLFYTTKRVGGDVIDSDAIKLLKFGTS